LLGEWIGLVPTKILIENVVVGDLPRLGTFTRGRVYLQVDVGENPPQVSEVLEDCNPKVAHFHSRFTLDIRRHGYGSPVRFSLRHLHILGHEDMCECFINQADIIDWAGAGALRSPKGPLRFRMYPKGQDANQDDTSSVSLPSWIFMEFSVPDEPPAESRKMNAFSIRVGDHTYNNEESKQFKAKYQLLSSSGEPRGDAYEPDEDRVIHLRNSKVRQREWIRCGVIWVFLFWFAFFVTILYFGTCWAEYKKLDVLVSHGVEFPDTPEDQAFEILRDCGYGDSFKRTAKQTLKVLKLYFKLKFRAFRHAFLLEDAGGTNLLRRLEDKVNDTSVMNFTSLANLTGDMCNPSNANVKKSCFDVPPGHGPVMFPTPILEYILPCDPTLTCSNRSNRFKSYEVVLDTGILMLIALGVLSLVLSAYYDAEERRVLRAGSDETEGPC
jgi:hypothetical protein